MPGSTASVGECNTARWCVCWQRNRGINICNKRYMRNAIIHWRKACDFADAQDAGSNHIIMKTRRLFLKQAFRMYRDGVAFRQQQEKNEKRCAHIRETL